MKDLRPLHYFMGIEAMYTSYGLFLSRIKYAKELPLCAKMGDCKSISMPMAPKTKLHIDDKPYSDPSHFRSIVGAL